LHAFSSHEYWRDKFYCSKLVSAEVGDMLLSNKNTVTVTV